MGREIKRVPLDFDAPLNEVWAGYLMPDEFRFPPCADCSYSALPTIMDRLFPTAAHGTGLTREAYAISQTFYPHMIGGNMAELLAWHDKLGQAEVDYLISQGRLSVWRDGAWASEARTAADVNREHSHDAINRSYLVQFRCQQLGITRQCPTCDGNGDIATAEQRQAYDDWAGTEPPEGEGWQLWETVSEGSPISPVFATAEELAQWMTENECTVDGPVASFDVALKFVRAGWAPSLIFSPATGVVDGVTWAGQS